MGRPRRAFSVSMCSSFLRVIWGGCDVFSETCARRSHEIVHRRRPSVAARVGVLQLPARCVCDRYDGGSGGASSTCSAADHAAAADLLGRERAAGSGEGAGGSGSGGVNSVITAEQAKKITGGRTPLVPVEYEAAVNALQACVTLDEAKYWNDKADVLAAWARIYHNDRAARCARALRLHAHRRMGELAEELRPTKKQKGFKGRQPGATSLLVEMGIKQHDAQNMRNVAKADECTFLAAVNSSRPPSPHYFSIITQGSASHAHKVLRARGYVQFKSFCNQTDPVQFARGFDRAESEKVRSDVVALIEWLDAFEQALPKTPATPKAPK